MEFSTIEIENPFLHRDLEDEIYMQIPPDYENINTHDQVCKLRKSLYELKKSTQAWLGRFIQAIKMLGSIDHVMGTIHCLFSIFPLGDSQYL